jgi:hypothetical protein
MQVDAFTTLLVGAFGAAALTVIGGFIGAAIQHRREHARWVRAQQMAAYLDFLHKAEAAPSNVENDVWTAHLDELGAAFAAIELVGPDAVAATANAHLNAGLEYNRVADRVRAVVDDDDSDYPNGPNFKALLAAHEVEAVRQSDTRRKFVLAARKALAIRGVAKPRGRAK